MVLPCAALLVCRAEPTSLVMAHSTEPNRREANDPHGRGAFRNGFNKELVQVAFRHFDNARIGHRFVNAWGERFVGVSQINSARRRDSIG